MGSIRIYKGMPPLTEEQKRRIIENAPKSDDDIDLSDIPDNTDGRWKRIYRARSEQKNSQNVAS